MNLMTAHSQWANRPADQRYTTLKDLFEATAKRRLIARTETMPAANLKVVPSLVHHEAGQPTQFKFETKQGGQARATHWSFGQICKSAGAPAGYLRKLPINIAEQAVAHGLKTSGEEIKLMRLDEDDGKVIQASTSPTYGRIWDADVVAAVQRIVESTNGRFFNPKEWSGKPSGLYASDHDVFIFMIDGGSIVDGGGERDQLHRGFIARNSEVGAGTMGLMTFLFRAVCGNHIIWGAENVNSLIIRHTSGGPARFDRDVLPTLTEYANSSTKGLEEQIRKAKDILLPEKDSEVIEWGMNHGLTRAEVRSAIDFAKAEEGDCRTLWNFVQGATASARKLEWVDARLDLEKRASSILSKLVSSE